MTKWKHVFRHFYKLRKIEKLKFLASISIQPPECILCRSAFGSDYSFESSWVCLYQLCTSGFGDFLPFFLANLLKLSQVRWGVLVNSNLQVFPQILNGIQVWALTGPLMDFPPGGSLRTFFSVNEDIYRNQNLLSLLLLQFVGGWPNISVKMPVLQSLRVNTFGRRSGQPVWMFEWRIQFWHLWS